MSKILRNTVLSLCLSSCLAMGMDEVGREVGSGSPATMVPLINFKELKGAARSIRIEREGGSFCSGGAFTDPVSGEITSLTKKSLLSALEKTAGIIKFLEDVLSALQATHTATATELTSTKEALATLQVTHAATDAELKSEKSALSALKVMQNVTNRDKATFKEQASELEAKIAKMEAANKLALQDLEARLAATGSQLEERIKLYRHFKKSSMMTQLAVKLH